jgi:hypothetical protein
MLALPVLGIGVTWSGKFMPDFAAMLLVTLSVGLSWERPRPVISGILATLGILMKPPVVLVLGLWGLASRDQVKKKISYVPFALGMGLFYYTWGLKSISLFQSGEEKFAVHLRPVGSAIFSFMMDINRLGKFLISEFPFAGGIFLLAYLVFLSYKKIGKVALYPWALLFLQVLGVGFLDGNHSYDHPYYFIATVPTLAVILAMSYDVSPKILRIVLLVGMTLHLAERIRWDVTAGTKLLSRDKECLELIKKTPHLPWRKGEVFRSGDTDYPELGLCFAERVGSKKSNYGFYSITSAIPEDCKPIAKTQSLEVVECNPHSNNSK